MRCLGKDSHQVIYFDPHAEACDCIKSFLPRIFHDLSIEIDVLDDHADDREVEGVLSYVELIHEIEEVVYWVLDKLVNFELYKIQVEDGDDRYLKNQHVNRIEESKLLRHLNVNVWLYKNEGNDISKIWIENTLL